MILVTGATGNTGRDLVDLLRAGGHEFRAMSRTPDTANLPPGVDIVAGDPGDLDAMTAALDGVDRLFWCVVGHMPEKAEVLVEAAKRTGTNHVVMLSSLSVEGTNPGSEIEDGHRGAEAVFRAAGLPATFLQPGTFMSNCLFWAHSVRTESVVHDMHGNTPAAPIDPADIAATAYAALTQPGHENVVHRMTGPEAITPQAETAILGELLGRRVGYHELQWDEALGFLRRLADGDAEATLRSIRGPGLPWDEPAPSLEPVIGRPQRTFRQWAEAHVDAFR